MNDATLSEFFENDYVAFGSYDNLRKLCSYIDGLKLSQRKAIYTLLKKYSNPSTETKTARLASSIAETTEYIHGEASLTGVLDSMAASFVGSNNFPLVTGHGNFGSRFAGSGSAAAPRYTYVSIAPLTLKLFPADDNALCKSQIFEGTEIEPIHFMPIYPVVLLNGCEGLTSGWKMQIQPRNPKDVIKYINAKIAGKKTDDPNKFIPYFKNFTGKTTLEYRTNAQGETESYFVNYGTIKQLSSTSLHITELPVSFNYASYIKILDRLVESNTIISYDDKSDPKSDTFDFKVTVKRTFFTTYTDEASWITVFRLSKILSEQLNLIDCNNRVVEFKSMKELLDTFIAIRLTYYNKRKAYLINKYTEQQHLNESRYIWCKGIIDDTIKIKNTPRANVIEQLEQIKGIIKKDDSFNYLLNMPLTSVTREKMDELLKDINELKELIITTRNTPEETTMTNDLTELSKHLT